MYFKIKCNLWERKRKASIPQHFIHLRDHWSSYSLLLTDVSTGLILLCCRSLSSAFVGLSFCRYQKQWESSLLLAHKSFTTWKSVSAFFIYLFRTFHLLPSGSNDKYLEAECSFKVLFCKEPNYVAFLSIKIVVIKKVKCSMFLKG